MYIPGFREELIEVPSQEPAQASVHAVEASGVVAELITARACRWVYALYALGSVALGAVLFRLVILQVALSTRSG